MDYISQPSGCWAEDTATGRVTLLAQSSSRARPYTSLQSHLDTPQGHRHEIWQASDLAPHWTWCSAPYEIYQDQPAVVTLFVDSDIGTIYILIPAMLGSTVKISPSSHSGRVDACRSSLCSSLTRCGELPLSQVKRLFEALSATQSRKLQDIALIALASLVTVDCSQNETELVDEDYTGTAFLTGC